jgi:imidazoleglycerol-phosphate dehydratase
MTRKASVERKTKETSVRVALDVDGSGNSTIETPIGFLTHMLDVISRHGRVDMQLAATGDVHIDYHHTV